MKSRSDLFRSPGSVFMREHSPHDDDAPLNLQIQESTFMLTNMCVQVMRFELFLATVAKETSPFPTGLTLAGAAHFNRPRRFQSRAPTRALTEWNKVIISISPYFASS